MARRTLITFCVVFFLLSLCAPSKGALLKITDVRHWSAPDHTRIVIDSDKSISYQTLQLKDPWRLVVNIKKAKATFNDRKIDIGDSIVHRIRVGQFDREMLRLVIDLVKPTQSKVFTLDKYLDKPYRLVIDLHRTDLVEKGKKARLKQKSKKYKIIVIDPGHGGEDSGAVGARGTLEKDVVLPLAKKLKQCIDQKKGFKAFLTREGDYFVPLEKRVEIAREYGADLFVSLHTDANFSKRVRGASVYCLSTKGASDEAAKLLAERENASDFIGGVSYASNRDLDSILIDLVQTQTINDSLRFGGMILNEVANVHTIKFKRPKQAGFAVLRATEVPSILIETGFISNRDDENLLRNKSFQLKLAKSLSKVSLNFVDMLAKRDGITVSDGTALRDKKGVHLVKPKETLWQIARDYNTTVDELIRLNNLKKTGHVRAGKKLLIP
ncbi:MAG: N-acetylmuramoyl-L-alanine amidase [Deltaproteobacteria bacterium]|nr:N-acetylmuramoyl-L-alanine amidase [Deltaproteobacteria bacterium]